MDADDAGRKVVDAFASGQNQVTARFDDPVEAAAFMEGGQVRDYDIVDAATGTYVVKAQGVRIGTMEFRTRQPDRFVDPEPWDWVVSSVGPTLLEAARRGGLAVDTTIREGTEEGDTDIDDLDDAISALGIREVTLVRPGTGSAAAPQVDTGTGGDGSGPVWMGFQGDLGQVGAAVAAIALILFVVMVVS